LSLEETAAKVTDLRGRMRSGFVVNTLKYLLKGGRVNRLQATVGSVLDIKPILKINQEGLIDQVDKIRGRKAALRRLLTMVEEQGDLTQQTVAISHALCPEDAEKIKEILLERFGVQKVIVGEIGAVIGTHVGPGTVALFFPGRI
jgi:DegV family protein with EDD domain